MSGLSRPAGDDAARDLLAAAFARLAASPTWTVTPREDGWPLELAVRPGVQWSRMHVLSGEAFATLIRDGQAYLYGWPYQASVLGYNRSPESIDAVVGDRWLQCDAAAFLRAGHDHDVREMLAKSVRPEGGDRVSVLAESESLLGTDSDRPVTDLLLNDGLVRVRHGQDGPSLVGVGEPDRGVLADIDYHDQLLELPDVAVRGVITLADALAAFAARRPARRSGGRTVRRRVPVVELIAPDNDTEEWTVRSDDLAGWGAGSGFEVEERVRELVSVRAVQLEPTLQFDSYAEAFVVYTDSEETARQLATLCQDPAHGAKRGHPGG